MKIVLKKRQTGATTDLVDWVNEDIKNRYIVTHCSNAARMLSERFDIPRSNVISCQAESSLSGLQCEIAYDEYQLFLRKSNEIDNRVKIITITV